MMVFNTHSIGKMKHRNQHEIVFNSVKKIRKTWSLQWSNLDQLPLDFSLCFFFLLPAAFFGSPGQLVFFFLCFPPRKACSAYFSTTPISFLLGSTHLPLCFSCSTKIPLLSAFQNESPMDENKKIKNKLPPSQTGF